MTVLATPSPYLRDRLLQAADGLRKDHETARLSLATAEQDVAAALALLEEARQVLAEAEAHRDRAQAAVDGITHDIAWCEQQAAERTPPAYDPDAALAATGLMPREDDGPISATLYQDNGLPMIWDASVPPGGYVCAATDGDGICGRPVESEPCDRPHDHQYVAGIGDPRCLCGNLWPCDGRDDLTAPGVADSRAQVAPHLPPPVPHDPAGPDAGTLAAIEAGHPLTTRGDIAGRHSHRASTETGRFRALGERVGLIRTEQHDDEQGDTDE